MTFEDFEKATSEELRIEAKKCFDIANHPQTDNTYQVAKLLEAQFYMRELEHREVLKERADAEKERRHDLWISTRDLLLEIVVIVLIGGEIWLAWRQGKDEDILMDKQNAVLSQLDKDMASTAATVASSEKTMEAMNTGIRAQIGRMSMMSMFVTFDDVKKKISIRNGGNSDVTLIGFEVDKQAPFLLKTPVLLQVSSGTEIDIDQTLKKLLTSSVGKESILTMFLRDDIGNEFVSTTDFVVNTAGGFNTGGSRIVQRNWDGMFKH